MERGTLSSEVNQKRCECGGGVGGSRGTQGVRQKRREREVRAQMRTGAPYHLPTQPAFCWLQASKRVTGQASPKSLAGCFPSLPWKDNRWRIGELWSLDLGVSDQLQSQDPPQP